MEEVIKIERYDLEKQRKNIISMVWF